MHCIKVVYDFFTSYDEQNSKSVYYPEGTRCGAFNTAQTDWVVREDSTNYKRMVTHFAQLLGHPLQVRVR